MRFFKTYEVGTDPGLNDTVQTIKVTFIDDVEPSSVWIIRDIPENRKTSIWGTAMVKPEETGKEYEAVIPMSEDEKYLFRMIDKNGLYYETDIQKLQDGWKLRLYSKDGRIDIKLDVFDKNGNLINECAVFCAAL